MNKPPVDLDRIPTLEELRAFFKENDWSAAAYIDLDYDRLPTETVAFLEHSKSLLDEHWEPLACEMGLKSKSSCYGEDNPLIAMRDSFQDLVSAGTYKLLEEQPEKATEILSDFIDDNGNFTVDADDFLHNAVETAMKVMDYEESAKVIKSIPTYEDFNHRKKNNYRVTDFDRKWNHERAEIEVVSLEELENESSETAVTADVTDEVLANIKKDNFWASISDNDRNLLNMRINGFTQEEIAKELGYKSHSAVTKRLQKLKKVFENCA